MTKRTRLERAMRSRGKFRQTKETLKCIVQLAASICSAAEAIVD